MQYADQPKGTFRIEPICTTLTKAAVKMCPEQPLRGGHVYPVGPGGAGQGAWPQSPTLLSPTVFLPGPVS